MSTDKKTLIFLGAGASMDAGLPDVYRLTKEVRELISNDQLLEKWISKESLPIFRDLIDDVFRYFRENESTKPRNKGSSEVNINIEDLIKTLYQAGNLEISPFKALVSLNDCLNKYSQSYINKDHNNSSYASNIFPFSAQILSNLCAHVLNEKSRTAEFDYLGKLLDFYKGQSIILITLNFDLGIESQAQALGIGYKYVGISHQENHDKEYLKLIKLHGSLNWKRDKENFFKTSLLSETDEPLIIIGDEDKLKPFDPFFELFYQFQKALVECSRIVILGYSFNDDHVNKAFTNRISMRCSLPEIIVVNPALNEKQNTDNVFETIDHKYFKEIASKHLTYNMNNTHITWINSKAKEFCNCLC